MNTAYLTIPSFLPERVHHGFSTRWGGVSEGVWSSLNLGPAVGDHPAHVEENHRRLRVAAGLPTLPFATLQQVHGDDVMWVGGTEKSPPAGCLHTPLPSEGVYQQVGAGDALITTDRGVILGIRVADCVPVLVGSEDGSIIAAVHAGWRGTSLGILPRVLAMMMTTRGLEARHLHVAIGPAIAGPDYQVGPEVAEAVARVLGEVPPGVIQPGEGDRYFVDLALANQAQAVAAGVPASQVFCPGWNTAGDPHLFFSHRRDRGHTGRMMAFISRGA